MKVILKKDRHLCRLNITFPSNTPMTLQIYKGEKFVEHPTRKGILEKVSEKDYIKID
jgi:hypothetical protein